MGQNASLDLFRIYFQFMKQIPQFKPKSANGLTRSELELLVMLVMNQDGKENPITVTGISNMLQITPAGVTHLINPLEEAGHVVRVPDPNDRRVVRIKVTKKGSDEAVALISELQEKMDELVDLLGEEDCQTFIRLMSRVIAYYSSKQEIKE